jgi:predicted Fe-Mo cluster-binding NifX family protein
VKIAVPTFGTRVSPRFDCAQGFLVLTVEAGDTSDRRELTAAGWAPHERINRLLELGVGAVLCGGIDCWSAESLQSAGVTVYSLVTGEIDDAVAALVRGDLDAEPVTQAGGRPRCRRLAGEARGGDAPGDRPGGMRHRRGCGRGQDRPRGENGCGRSHGPPP